MRRRVPPRHRLDRAFGVRLPEELISDAATPKDLLVGLLSARSFRSLAVPASKELPVKLPELEEPRLAATLLEVLSLHVQAHEDRPHIRLWLGDELERAITYGELDRAAREGATGLLDSGVQPRERIAIMLPTSAEFFFSFFAVIMAGAIPVPIYPPFRRSQVEDHMRRQAGILRNAQANLLITDAEIRPMGTLLQGLTRDLRAVVTFTELCRSGVVAVPLPASSGDTALIQYTSGSTGDPKGVVLAHANLLANVRAMGEAMQASSTDLFVSWLPLYHDMGLIGAWLGCLYYGAPTAVMPPLSFLANPARWLWSIHRHRATLSAAPNFAFELCSKNVRDEDIRGLDLSSLRMVVNGAEPVSPSTIARFTERFGAFGFPAEAMAPVYGLAELSVGLAFPPVGRRPIVDRVQRVALARDGNATRADEHDTTALEFVACGRPLPRHQIRIVDEAGSELPDRRQGRLEFKGPSATAGYFRNEEKTRGLFDGDWLDSGDLAYIANGDVFLTGRIKDMIIRAGRNIYPHELEETVGRIDGIRKGCVVAFASRDERSSTERLVVMAETRLAAEPEKKKTARGRDSAGIAQPPRITARRDRARSPANGAQDVERRIMTPRPRIQWVDLEEPAQQVLSRVRSCPHAQLLACRGSIDEIVGIVRKQDITDQVLDGRPPDVETIARPPLIVHEATTILRTLDLFRELQRTLPSWSMSSEPSRASSREPICSKQSPATYPRSTLPYGRRSRSATTAHT